MPYNRFTESKRLTEAEFIGIVFDYVLGRAAAVCAERIGVSEKTVQKYYKKIRDRLFRIFGETAKDSFIHPLLLSPDDVIWEHIYECIFECPSNVVSDYEFSQRDQSPSFSKKQGRQTISVSKYKKLAQCTGCKLLHPYVLPEVFSFILSMKVRNQRGFDKSQFGYLFLDEYIRRFIIIPTTNSALEPTNLVRRLLKDMSENPL